ncbi:MAG: MltA domain-containing protein [Deltaproteobacteria bacterium]|nr:MltA domain-containing protein [Deltaproteobacteria bacterium]
MRLARNDDLNTSAKSVLVFFLSLTILLASACGPSRLATPVSRLEQPLQEVDPQSVELERDDLSRELLVQAVQNSLLYYERLPEDRLVKFGPEEVPVSRMKRTLETFLELLTETRSWKELADIVREKFIIYRSVGRNVEQEVLFTGYYEPTIQGSLTPDDHYRFPIYGVPDDLLKIDLGLFGKQYEGTRLVGRTEGNRVVPYYSREDIEFDGKLAGKGYELVWVADPVERFFLRIQGSGRIRLLDGEYIRLGYAAKNGRPWGPIGRLLIEKGLIPKEAMSMQAIRRYLEQHPEEMAEIFSYDQSYVFFSKVEGGPFGNIAVPLTPGRSIATDSSLFPKGALAFIQCQKPIFAKDGVILGWTPFARYSLNQDTGGAIRGPGRVDLFWGSGPFSRIAAGHLKHPGALYFLLIKESSSQ